MKINGEDEDITLSSLLSASKIIIKQGTGITQNDIDKDKDAKELYKLAQKIIIINLYDNGGISEKENVGLTSLYMQLEVYKLNLDNGIGGTI